MTKIGKGLMSVCIPLALAGGILSCGRKNDNENTQYGDRPDKEIRNLMETLRKGDAPGFAALCVYPIPRPYPLRDIADSTAMVEYFPVMVDDSLQNIMSRTRVDDWESFGWRGWSMRDSQPVWYDEGVLFVDYESKAERALQKILAREELMTLASEYRDGWTPVATLAEARGSQIFRIDSKGDVYRLMGFVDSSAIGGKPYLLLDGSMTEEGTAESQIFRFSGDGVNAEYIPDAEPPAYITMSTPNGSSDIEVTPVYWRDLVNTHK